MVKNSFPTIRILSTNWLLHWNRIFFGWNFMFFATWQFFLVRRPYSRTRPWNEFPFSSKTGLDCRRPKNKVYFYNFWFHFTFLNEISRKVIPLKYLLNSLKTRTKAFWKFLLLNSVHKVENYFNFNFFFYFFFISHVGSSVTCS